MGLLSLSIWTPIFFGVVLLALGRDEHAKAVRWVALIGAVISLLVTLPLGGWLIYCCCWSHTSRLQVPKSLLCCLGRLCCPGCHFLHLPGKRGIKRGSGWCCGWRV